METQLTPLEERQKQWVNFANLVGQVEPKLKEKQEQVLAIMSDIPTDVTKIVGYEENLATIKNILNSTVSERKKLTSIFDRISERLMLPEKEIIAKKSEYESALISVKQQKAKNDALLAAHEAELKSIKEKCANAIIEAKSGFEQEIISRVSRCLEHCLKLKLTQKAVDELMPKMKAALDNYNFSAVKPSIPLVYVLQAEVDEIWGKIPKPVVSDLIKSYHNRLAEKFEFYETYLSNAEAALQLEQSAAANDIKKAEEEQSAAKVATKLEALSTPNMVNVEPQGKSLKQKYALDMEENLDNVMIIATAFLSNISACKEKIRVKNLFNLSIGQMGECLVNLKNEDDKFSVTGIKFKIVDKL